MIFLMGAIAAAAATRAAAPLDLGTLLTAAMVLAGVVYTAAQGRRATREANKLAGRNADVEGLQRLSQEQRADLIRLQEHRKEDHDKIAVLEQANRDLRIRVEHLEEKDRDHRRRIRAAVRYIRALLAHIRLHTSEPPPTMPVDLHTDMEVGG